jgi:hypothetical protein
MTAVLTVYDGEGRVVGRCDANCHDATEPQCTCICGGANHGRGQARAIEHTREHVEAMLGEDQLRAFRARTGLPARRVEAGDAVVQERLW